MRNLLYVLLLFSCVLSAQTITLTDSDIASFYGAKGHGRVATGGRGQTVYQVTNLNNSGAGSFREAISSSNRYIIFRVGGTITLTSDISVSNISNITIAGETAPANGDGITIYGGMVRFVKPSNIIIRHIRVRVGDNGVSGQTDGLAFRNDDNTFSMQNIMVDHVTVSWGSDESISFNGEQGGISVNQNFTVSNCIVSEAFGVNYGTLASYNISNISFFGNLWAHNRYRNPASSSDDCDIELINNATYNAHVGFEPAAGDGKQDMIGNLYKGGPTYDFANTTSPFVGYAIKMTSTSAGNSSTGSAIENNTNNTYYADDNLWIETDGTENLNFGLGSRFTGSTENGSRLLASNITPIAVTAVSQYIVDNAGARMGISGRDALDQEMVDDFVVGTGDGSVNSEAETSGLPVLTAGTAYADSDGDGLSDEFEAVNGAISPNTRPVTATLVDGTIIDQTSVTAGIRYTYMDIQNMELAGDWGSGTPTGGGGGGASSPDGTKNGTSAMLIAH